MEDKPNCASAHELWEGKMTIVLGSKQLYSEIICEEVNQKRERISLLTGENDKPQISGGHWSQMDICRMAEVRGQHQ